MSLALKDLYVNDERQKVQEDERLCIYKIQISE
jgi:hypothetical protein